MKTSTIIYSVIALLVVAGIIWYVRTRKENALRKITILDLATQGENLNQSKSNRADFTGTTINGQVFNVPRAGTTNSAGATSLESLANGTGK